MLFLRPYQPLPTDDSIPPPPPTNRRLGHVLYVFTACTLVIVAFYAGRHIVEPADLQPTADDLACRPFIPDLFADDPPTLSDAGIAAAVSRYQLFLESDFSARDIDGLSVAVTTSATTIFEGHWGQRRANESTNSSDTPTQFSQYRVASVSKLLLTYEAWILEQRGIISWNDPVARYLPTFQPNYTSWSASTVENTPITLRHLATHQSGLGHDWPPGPGSQFPLDLRGAGTPPMNGLPFPSHDDVLSAVYFTPLVSPPGSLPVYSNAAFGILGMALVAANRLRGGDTEPSSIAELMLRDVFLPLGMVGTHYRVTNENRDLVIVPSVGTDIIDMDFLDAMNSSGGMFTSTHDLALFVRTLLDPASGPLTRATIDWWLRPVYSFAEDDWTELGIMWEIFKHTDSHGRRRRLYVKLGELGVTHAAVALHPGSGYSVIVLMSGAYADAAGLAYAGFDVLQPAFDAAQDSLASQLFAGVWRTSDSGNRTSEARISVRRGTIWMDAYNLQGTEVLMRVFKAKSSLPLRSTGRRDEMRIDVGTPSQNGRKHRSCMPHWAAFDNYGMRGGAAVNLIYFTGGMRDEKRKLHVPAVGVVMERVSWDK